ncbi:MAG TPA: phosphoribosyl-AMP cyclohydrolase [Candidatus Latescibacteria bacterium]|nr:phosphoribosyl-AMP cyclohydrolase [Candidatus Latescibacterota bacterium]
MLDQVKFDDRGLVTAIAQDADNGEILMLAYMNRESLDATLRTGIMTYWSRSRGKLWVKGETSGHTQQVVEMRIDCDGDALLFKVRQKGGACHTGFRSCFYRKLTPDGLVEDGDRVFQAQAVYGTK